MVLKTICSFILEKKGVKFELKIRENGQFSRTSDAGGGARGGTGGCSFPSSGSPGVLTFPPPQSGKNFVSVREFLTENCFTMHRKIPSFLLFSPPVGEPSLSTGKSWRHPCSDVGACLFVCLYSYFTSILILVIHIYIHIYT